MTKTKLQKMRDTFAKEVMGLTKKQHSVTKKFYWIDFTDERMWDYEDWKPDESIKQATLLLPEFGRKYHWAIISMPDAQIRFEYSPRGGALYIGHKLFADAANMAMAISKGIYKTLEANVD